MKDDSVQCVCAGHVCLDIIPEFPAKEGVGVADLLRPGSLLVVGKAQLAPGGPVANVGIALHKLGVLTEFRGKVGDDLFGEGLLKLFKPYGAERGMAVAGGEVTSYSVVISPPGVDRIFLHNPGANDTYCAADVDFARLGKAAIFHLGYPPLMRRLYADGGEELAAIYRHAKEAGATTSLDLAFPDPASPAGMVDWRAILRKALPFVDVFVPSCEELMYMLDAGRFWKLRKGAAEDPVLAYTGDDLRFLASESLRLGAAMVGLKVGRRGFYLATGSHSRLEKLGRARPRGSAFECRELWQSAYQVDRVVSATGSGDNTIAGFLAAFLRELPPEECLHVACAVGADNVKVLDATSGVRSWDETVGSIPGQRLRDPEAGAGFAFDPGRKLWRGSFDGKGVG